MQKRNLGQGLTVSQMGLGCMGMSEFYGTADESEAEATIHRALELGMDFLDTADMYGPFTNERLVGRAIAGRPVSSPASSHQAKPAATREPRGPAGPTSAPIGGKNNATNSYFEGSRTVPRRHGCLDWRKQAD